MKIATVKSIRPIEIIKQKILQLFDTHWIETVWDNFINYTKEAISNE